MAVEVWMRPCDSVFGHPLDPVGTALVLEHRVGPVPLHREGDLPEAADLGGGLREVLDRVAAPLRVAGEHLVEVAGEQSRLIAAGAGPDLDDHVLVVVRVALDHRQADLLGELLEPAGGVGDAPCLSLRVVPVLGEQLAGALEVVIERQPFAAPARARIGARGTRARPRRSAPGRRSPPGRTSAARARRSGPESGQRGSRSHPKCDAEAVSRERKPAMKGTSRRGCPDLVSSCGPKVGDLPWISHRDLAEPRARGGHPVRSS